MNSDNFTVIFGFMTNDLGLSGNELLIYATIYGFSQDGQSCFKGSRKWLAESFNISLPTVDKALKGLVEKGLIEKIENEVNGVTFFNYRTLQGVKNLYRGSKESLQGGKETLQGGSKESLHQIYNKQNIEDNTKGNNSKVDDLEGVLLSVAIIANNPDLLQAFKDFIDMRKRIRKPLTVRALQLSVNEAYKLAKGDTSKMRAIVEQSIQRSWQGLFPLKEDQQPTQAISTAKNSKSALWDEMLKEANNAETDVDSSFETFGGFLPE